MDEIIRKLGEMGVSVDSGSVKCWLKKKGRAIHTIDDAAIITMAAEFGEAIAPRVENLPVGRDKIEGGGESGQSIEAIARSDAVADAELVLSTYQSSYQAEFARRIKSLATFRSEYRNKAVALLTA